jgi:hypothetical protein
MTIPPKSRVVGELREWYYNDAYRRYEGCIYYDTKYDKQDGSRFSLSSKELLEVRESHDYFIMETIEGDLYVCFKQHKFTRPGED